MRIHAATELTRRRNGGAMIIDYLGVARQERGTYRQGIRCRAEGATGALSENSGHLAN